VKEPAPVEDRDAATEQKLAELAILKQSLDDAKAKAEDYFNQLVRLKAEFENFRKRTEKEKADARRWGREEVVLRLIEILDVMEQADAAARKAADPKSIAAGLNMLFGEFRRFLKEEGVEEVAAPVGEKYSPESHEALETAEEEGDGGAILEVYQKGYRFQGRLLRPARVKVSKSKSPGRGPKADDRP
jgi:molecular chaperone GrpE